MLFVLAACSIDENVDEAASGESNTEESTGDNTINVGMSEDLVSLDPHGSNDSASGKIRRNIYESLIFQDEELELTPGLTTEWEATGDSLGTLN